MTDESRPYDPNSHTHSPEDTEALEVMAVDNVNVMNRYLGALQADLTMKDAFDSAEFRGGMGYVLKIMERLTQHVAEAVPSMGIKPNSVRHGALLGSLLSHYLVELDRRLAGQLVHVPQDLRVVSWGSLSESGPDDFLGSE